VLCAGLLSLAAGCSAAGGGEGDGVASTASATVKAAESSGGASSGASANPVKPSTGSSGPASTSSSLGKASAAEAMAVFVAAARTQDARLREAARLVNGGISTSKVTVSSQTAKAMQAVDLPSVAKAIPAGLGNDLLTGTMMVYSELVSRSDSMSLFRFPAIYDRQHVDPHTAPNADQMLVCLSHGAPAAQAFPADLQALEQLARTLPPVDVSAPTSRAAAEVAVYVALVDKANGCSETCGGAVLRRILTVRWDSDPSDKSKASGTLGETMRGTDFDLSQARFESTYDRSQGWIANIQVC